MNLTQSPSWAGAGDLGTNALYRSIYLDLKRRISRGELAPAERIGTEKDLAEHYNVSVGTIRKTQDLLVREGLLIKQQGRGTFVAPDVARQRRLLWVCGLDVFDGDISPYYTHFLRACHRAGEQFGFSIEPAWLSHIRPSDSEPYMTSEAAGTYAGYIFVGCEFPKHRMLRYAVDSHLPHAHLVHWQPGPHNIQIDQAQGTRLGIEQLRERGCQRIAVMGFDQHLGRLSDLFKELDVKVIETPTGRNVREVEYTGYLVTQHRLASDIAQADGLLILDDILARGATRALLQHSPQPSEKLKVAVMSSRRSVFPFGMPVIHVVHDSEQAARSAIDLISDQLRGKAPEQGVNVAYEVAPDQFEITSNTGTIADTVALSHASFQEQAL